MENNLFNESRFYLSKHDKSFLLYDNLKNTFYYKKNLFEITEKLEELKDSNEIQTDKINFFNINLYDSLLYSKNNFKINPGFSTTKKLINCINKNHKYGKKISINTILTSDSPNPLQIALYFKNLHVDSLNIKIQFIGNKSFNSKNILQLLENYKKLFERIIDDICVNDYSLIELLKDDISFCGIKLLLFKDEFNKVWNHKNTLSKIELKFQQELKKMNIDFIHQIINKKINLLLIAEKLGLQNNKNINIDKSFFIKEKNQTPLFKVRYYLKAV